MWHINFFFFVPFLCVCVFKVRRDGLSTLHLPTIGRINCSMKTILLIILAFQIPCLQFGLIWLIESRKILRALQSNVKKKNWYVTKYLQGFRFFSKTSHKQTLLIFKTHTHTYTHIHKHWTYTVERADFRYSRNCGVRLRTKYQKRHKQSQKI